MLTYIFIYIYSYIFKYPFLYSLSLSIIVLLVFFLLLHYIYHQYDKEKIGMYFIFYIFTAHLLLNNCFLVLFINY